MNNEENTQNNINNGSEPVIEVAQDEIKKISTASKKLSMPVAILLAGIIIALAVVVSSGNGNSFKLKNNNGKINVSDIGDTREMEQVTKNDHIKGDLNKAKIAVVEFSDLQCPYCRQIHPVLTKMVETYGTDVAWVYRHFPLESIHPRARISAHGSECAAELAGNDGFWKFIDGIFTYAGTTDPFTDEGLNTFAVNAGVNVDAFKACQTSGKYNDKIDDYLDDASSSGAQGTPDITVVNLKTGEAVHIGADPSILASVIEKMLK